MNQLLASPYFYERKKTAGTKSSQNCKFHTRLIFVDAINSARLQKILVVVFFFFFLRKIIVQYKCWKGRGFGGEQGGEKEVREVGKEKKKREKGEG